MTKLINVEVRLYDTDELLHTFEEVSVIPEKDDYVNILDKGLVQVRERQIFYEQNKVVVKVYSPIKG